MPGAPPAIREMMPCPALATGTVTVFREGEEAASASYVPEYELEDFNGKGCGDCETTPTELLYVDPA